MTPAGLGTIDTDWHVDALYGFLNELDATFIVATHSRNVVDLNRPPDGGKLYPGRAETGICPTETFAGDKLYTGDPPGPAARAQRVQTYWQPYHAALAEALARTQAIHGHAHLLDAHSIRSRVPRLFDGDLPDLNFGTNDGVACAPALAARVVQSAADRGFSHVLNGRFKGGYITRHYGRPAQGVNAVQLELAQHTYLDDSPAASNPPQFDPPRAARLIEILHSVVAELSRP
jgi:N-formylglutamate deformylase